MEGLFELGPRGDSTAQGLSQHFPGVHALHAELSTPSREAALHALRGDPPRDLFGMLGCMVQKHIQWPILPQSRCWLEPYAVEMPPLPPVSLSKNSKS